VIAFVLCPLFLLAQEPRHLFNGVHYPNETLPFCPRRPVPLPEIRRDRYVVFRPTDTGTGNRILGLVSSYALSLVTGRSLLVDWQTTSVFGAQFLSLFESPAELFGNQTIEDHEYHFLNLVYCRHCSVRFRHDVYSILTSQNLTEEFNRRYIIVRSNVYFAPALLANPIHRRALCSVADADALFHTLYKSLIHLSPQLSSALNATLKAFDGRDVIGVQIRLKDRVGFPPHRVGNFFNCAAVLAAKYNNSLVFIASDSDALKKRAQLVFGDRLYRTKDRTRQFSEAGIKTAVLDMMILANCREVVLTPFSTFGAVAAGIGRVVPHFVTREEGYCIKDLKSEPKFHYWHAMSRYTFGGMSSSDMLNQDDSFM
jgi:hypothetical protein